MELELAKIWEKSFDLRYIQLIIEYRKKTISHIESKLSLDIDEIYEKEGEIYKNADSKDVYDKQIILFIEQSSCVTSKTQNTVTSAATTSSHEDEIKRLDKLNELRTKYFDFLKKALVDPKIDDSKKPNIQNCLNCLDEKSKASLIILNKVEKSLKNHFDKLNLPHRMSMSITPGAIGLMKKMKCNEPIIQLKDMKILSSNQLQITIKDDKEESEDVIIANANIQVGNLLKIKKYKSYFQSFHTYLISILDFEIGPVIPFDIVPVASKTNQIIRLPLKKLAYVREIYGFLDSIHKTTCLNYNLQLLCVSRSLLRVDSSGTRFFNIILMDKTRQIRLVLFMNQVNICELAIGKTYLMKNIRVEIKGGDFELKINDKEIQSVIQEVEPDSNIPDWSYFITSISEINKIEGNSTFNCIGIIVEKLFYYSKWMLKVSDGKQSVKMVLWSNQENDKAVIGTVVLIIECFVKTYNKQQELHLSENGCLIVDPDCSLTSDLKKWYRDHISMEPEIKKMKL